MIISLIKSGRLLKSQPSKPNILGNNKRRSLSFLFVNEIVEVVLHQDGNHRKRSYSEIVGLYSHPQAEKTFVFDCLHRTVHDALVGKHSLRVYIEKILLGLIFRIFTFMLSKGREPKEAETPEIADPISLIAVVSFVSCIQCCNFSLASL